MPSDTENIQYLYLVLTHGGPPTIDWASVCIALNLKHGAVTKRWSRLKQTMAKNETPPASSYQFLWLCLKHSTRDKPLDWVAIAKECNTTAGAASKRYSRMKQAFESGAAPPAAGPSSPVKNTPVKNTSVKRTPKKATSKAVEGTPTPKRKRASPKKKVVKAEEDDDGDAFDGDEVNDDALDSDEEEQGHVEASPTKKQKTVQKTPPAKGKKPAVVVVVATSTEEPTNPPTPTTEATTLIKDEPFASSVNDKDPFFEAQQAVEQQLSEDEGAVDRASEC